MYNTRRGAYGSPASNVGQRRPQGNFVPGGQLKPNNQQQGNQRNQNQGPVPPVQAQQKPKQDVNVNLQKTAEVAINNQKAQEAKIVFKTEPVVPPKPVVPAANNVAPKPVPPPATEDVEMKTDEPVELNEDGTQKTKPAWLLNRKSKGKITKAEKVRRRNMRLKKMLQPKNALMVLNEIAGVTTYELTEIPANMYGNNMMAPNFKASVAVDGQIYEGHGKNKPAAKTAAAENALKHLVLTKMAAAKNNPVQEEKPVIDNVDGEGDEKMEEDKDDNISFCHVASFALYKLFTNWDDGAGKMLSRTNSQTSLASNDPTKNAAKNPPEMRPSKKMPENPEQMNPVMLLNQMYPNAIYEEVCKTGVPPKIVFTMKCTVNEKAFIGHGSNKKIARREAAFQACKELLGVQYPEVQA